MGRVDSGVGDQAGGLRDAREDPDPLVREHATRALGQNVGR
jgi:hypothetical protein